jgi:hypothetical protein
MKALFHVDKRRIKQKDLPENETVDAGGRDPLMQETSKQG